MIGNYLEECQEVIKPFLLRATIKTHSTGVQEYTDQAYSEVIIWHVKRN